MDWHHVLQALLSLVFVIGLLLLTLWLFKYCQLKGGNCRWARQLKAGQRLNVVESRRLDNRNSVVLLKRDDQEFLILLGSNANLLLDRSLAPQRIETND